MAIRRIEGCTSVSKVYQLILFLYIFVLHVCFPQNGCGIFSRCSFPLQAWLEDMRPCDRFIQGWKSHLRPPRPLWNDEMIDIWPVKTSVVIDSVLGICWKIIWHDMMRHVDMIFNVFLDVLSCNIYIYIVGCNCGETASEVTTRVLSVWGLPFPGIEGVTIWLLRWQHVQGLWKKRIKKRAMSINTVT